LAKEFDLLQLLMENQGKALKKEYLFNTVWGSDSNSELQTLHVHINRLRQKLGDDPKNAKRLITVWGFCQCLWFVNVAASLRKGADQGHTNQ